MVLAPFVNYNMDAIFPFCAEAAQRYINQVRNKLSMYSLQIGQLMKVLRIKGSPPVFVIGSGRCGTSLLVKILQSHSDIVCYTDEANDLWHPNHYPFQTSSCDFLPFEFDPGRFTQESLGSWPSDHHRLITFLLLGFHTAWGRQKVFVLKSAMISFMIPKLIELYPKAKFMHIFRSGPSTVDSYFKKNFPKVKGTVTESDYYRVCAKYWRACVLRIEKDKSSLNLDGATFFELSYEALCDDTSFVLMRLANFLGVKHTEFSYDLSKIRSTNYKVMKSTGYYQYKNQLNSIISPAMELLGYSSTNYD
jgi:hypothetical protein